MNDYKLLLATGLLMLASSAGLAQETNRAQDLEPAVNFDVDPTGTAPAPVAEAPQTENARDPVQVETGESSATNFDTMDHLNLDATSVTGNRELPKVLYIVPWKKSDLGDLGGRPVNSLLDEVLTPVDREVFQRHLQYYGDVQAD